jgi:hypothetical protein
MFTARMGPRPSGDVYRTELSPYLESNHMTSVASFLVEEFEGKEQSQPN